MMKKNRPHCNKLRIIGGEYRSRIIHFPNLPEIRPTSDRLRETLFNWLGGDLTGFRVLDLFAGSGALGLEALSRGASFATFVDKNKKILESIEKHLQLFHLENACVIQHDVFKSPTLDFVLPFAPFDLIFLDPPFSSPKWPEILYKLEQSKILSAHAWIYLESEKNTLTLEKFDFLKIKKESIIGDVQARLCRLK